MKKVFVLLGVFVMLLAFTACGNDEEKCVENCWSCGEGISKEVTYCSYCGVAVNESNALSEHEENNPVINIETSETMANIPETKAETIDENATGFVGSKLRVNISGNIQIYERFKAGTDSFTIGQELDSFYTQTEIEGIIWSVYSTKEHPDLSYVLVISGTNSSWTYRLADTVE